MATPNMSLVAEDIDKSVVVGSLETAEIAGDDCIPFYDISAQNEPKQRKTTLNSLIDVLKRVFGFLPIASASDANKPVIVGQDGTYQLGAAVSETEENFVISPEDWNHSTTIAPFNWYAEKVATTIIGTDSVVELINDDPFSFAAYCLAIAPVNSQTIRFLAYSAPGEALSMRVIIHG